MLSFNELKAGTRIVYNNEPWDILESHHVKMAQRRPVRQVKLKNILNGKVVKTAFQQGEMFEEALLESRPIKFIYAHKDDYCFCCEDKLQERFFLTEKLLVNAKWFLMQNKIYEGIVFDNKIINIKLPNKITLKVISSPPGIRGDSAKSAFKEIILESGLKVRAPLFIKEGDAVIINTETLEYVGRGEEKD